MNLFRSKEHAERWSGFRAEAREGLVPARDLAWVFAARLFRERGRPDYVSNLPELRQDFIARLKARLPGRAFWGTAD